jgi:hypothetical protein
MTQQDLQEGLKRLERRANLMMWSGRQDEIRRNLGLLEQAIEDGFIDSITIKPVQGVNGQEKNMYRLNYGTVMGTSGQVFVGSQPALEHILSTVRQQNAESREDGKGQLAWSFEEPDNSMLFLAGNAALSALIWGALFIALPGVLVARALGRSLTRAAKALTVDPGALPNLLLRFEKWLQKNKAIQDKEIDDYFSQLAWVDIQTQLNARQKWRLRVDYTIRKVRDWLARFREND